MPQRVLAVDTSTTFLRLAFRFGEDRTARLDEPAASSHGQLLLRKIDDLLSSTGCDRTSLEGVVVNIGPGSFTGLRIGLAAAKGIVTGLEIPLVGVSLFDIAARLLRERGHTVVLAPFKRDAVVRSAVREGEWQREQLDCVSNDPATLTGLIKEGSVAAIGFDADAADESVEALNSFQLLQYNSIDLLEVGLARLQKSEYDDLSDLEPVYAQPSQAEINLARRKQS